MDRAPQPSPGEEHETPESMRRKKRLINRLRGFLAGEQNDVEEVDFSGLGSEESSDVGEFWSRESEESGVEAEGFFARVQQLGRNVLEQTMAVQGFAESVAERVVELPSESRENVVAETEQLQSAASELRVAAEELDEELDNLEEATTDRGAEPSQQPDRAEAPAPEPAEPEKEKPKKDYSEAMSMARLVIATLIGGGLGALVGEGGKKEKSREKPRRDKVIERQQAKIDAQEAELRQLKAAKPEAVKQKEYVEKATHLAEKQTELTQTTVEQVRQVTKQATESEATFKIPEQQKAEKLAETKAERAAEVNERLREGPESRDDKPKPGEDKPAEVQKPITQASPFEQHLNPTQQPIQPPKPTQPAPKVGIYWLLLIAAIVIALGLLMFGPK